MTVQQEYWLSGPIDGVSSLLQPVAHALLQARDEVEQLVIDFPAELLWERPAGMASVGFHLQHLSGVVDRLFTYARAKSLSPSQLQYLSSEGEVPVEGTDLQKLVDNFRNQVDIALQQLRHTENADLILPRGVGRKQVPSTVISLLFHAAEHTMRHLGQLIVTIGIARHNQVNNLQRD